LLMKIRVRLTLAFCLLLTVPGLFSRCYARPQEQDQVKVGVVRAGESADTNGAPDQPKDQKQTAQGNTEPNQASEEFSETKLGLSLLKNITLDQKAIWTSPFHLRLADADWIVPFAGIAAITLASDSHVSRGLTSSSSRISKSNSFSNYGLAAFGGIAGGTYLLGKITGSDHAQEAGLLSGEAAADALAVTTVLQYSFGRQRPSDGNGMGYFWHGGTSFPSDHSAAAWAVASVMAHEYHGTFAKLFFYGLASAVSLSRVTGKDHFPTDVLAGGAIGYLTGQYVFRTHHDPDLDGSSWETFAEAREKGGRDFKNTGSPYVPLDSWVYPNLDRLIALGYIHSAFQDVRPLTRTECAALVQEAGESIAAEEAPRGEADKIFAELQKEFQNEASVLAGEGKEQSVQLESVYTNVTEIAGKPLNDSYHFGQTIIDNFGRPYQEGFNTYDGFSGYATTGRYVFYVRGEFQSAPSAPAYSLAARQAIANADQTPLQPAIPTPATDQFPSSGHLCFGNCRRLGSFRR
jgi:membrane-associated phospholipid phosphatase